MTLPSDLEEVQSQMWFYARLFKDVQKEHTATTNRVKAWERNGIGLRLRSYLHSPVADLRLSPLQDRTILEVLERAETGIKLELKKLTRRHFMASWVAETQGISEEGFGVLVGLLSSMDKETGEVRGPERFDTVSKLWKYCGLAVGSDGRRDHRQAGVVAGYNPTVQAYLAALGESLVKGRGVYRVVYLNRKAHYLAKPRLGPSGCPMGRTHQSSVTKAVVQCVKEGDTSAHLHAAARSYAVKELLKAMWIEWRVRMSS